jgi:hypothetical protein
MVTVVELDEAAATAMDQENRRHRNSQQPEVVIELAPYPALVPRQPPAPLPPMVGAPVAERGPESSSCSSGDVLFAVRRHTIDSTCDA